MPLRHESAEGGGWKLLKDAESSEGLKSPSGCWRRWTGTEMTADD